MTTITEHRHLMIGLGLSTVLVLIQARPITNLFCPMLALLLQHKSSAPMSSQPAALVTNNVLPKSHLIRPPLAVKAKADQPIVMTSEPVVMELQGARLNSNLLDYSMIFSGVVTCAGQPCSATVDIGMESSTNSSVMAHGQTAADGTYSITVPIKEVMHESVDWKITITNNRDQSVTGELHGRRILMDDLEVPVENDSAL